MFFNQNIRSNRDFLAGGAIESMLWVGVRLCIEEEALEDASPGFLPPGRVKGNKSFEFLGDSF